MTSRLCLSRIWSFSRTLIIVLLMLAVAYGGIGSSESFPACRSPSLADGERWMWEEEGEGGGGGGGGEKGEETLQMEELKGRWSREKPERERETAGTYTHLSRGRK
jgi:hypothetical protein